MVTLLDGVLAVNFQDHCFRKEFQEFPWFSNTYAFLGLSRPGNFNILLLGLSRVCKNPDDRLIYSLSKSL